jgi:hypothetical protein
MKPECPRGHPPGSSPDRRLVAVGLVIAGVPFLLGAVGSAIIVADEAIAPLIMFAAWTALAIYRIVRGKSGFELLAVMGCLVTLQLLLDLHTRHLGDIVIAGVHVCGLIALLVVHCRRAR